MFFQEKNNKGQNLAFVNCDLVVMNERVVGRQHHNELKHWEKIYNSETC